MCNFEVEKIQIKMRYILLLIYVCCIKMSLSYKFVFNFVTIFYDYLTSFFIKLPVINGAEINLLTTEPSAGRQFDLHTLGPPAFYKKNTR